MLKRQEAVGFLLDRADGGERLAIRNSAFSIPWLADGSMRKAKSITPNACHQSPAIQISPFCLTFTA